MQVGKTSVATQPIEIKAPTIVAGHAAAEAPKANNRAAAAAIAK